MLTVTREGVLFLDRVPVTADKLEEHLRFELTSRGEDTVLIRGDKSVLLASAVDVMAIAKRAGARNVGILSPDAGAPAARSSTGTLDPALLAREVRSHMPDIRRCYETALKATPGLSGRIVLKFAVAADGQVETPSLGSRPWAAPRPKAAWSTSPAPGVSPPPRAARWKHGVPLRLGTRRGTELRSLAPPKATP